MQEKDFKAIEKLKHLVAKKVKIHEVKVFGSRARGDATQDSDLEVLIVVDFWIMRLKNISVIVRGKSGFLRI